MECIDPIPHIALDHTLVSRHSGDARPRFHNCGPYGDQDGKGQEQYAHQPFHNKPPCHKTDSDNHIQINVRI